MKKIVIGLIATFFFIIAYFYLSSQKISPLEKEIATDIFHGIQESKEPLEDIFNQNMTEESVDQVWLRISELCDYGYDLDQLNEYQRNFWLVFHFLGETGSGGIEQFFYNGYEFVESTLHTLQTLKLNDSYQYLKNAQEIVEMYSDPKMSEQLNKIDEYYYNDVEEECYHFLIQYLQEYKDEFIEK